MPKAQVLVTLTAEAVVDVPADVDVEAFLRERVALLWEDISVVQVVQEPSASIAWFELPDAAAIEAEPVPEAPLVEASAVSAPEEQQTVDEDGTLVETARTIGSALGKVAHAVEEIAGGQAASEEATVGAETADQERAAATSGGEWAEGSTRSESEQPVLAHVTAGNGDHVLERDELMALFSDPLYEEMVRSAVRDRAAVLLEGVVAEVVAELEPLLRRQLERGRL